MKIQRLHQLPWPTNPKTPEGWPKRVAIATLSGLAVFLLALPIAALLFFDHYQRLYPNDPQNLLSALTSAVVVGLVSALLTIPVLLALLRLFPMLRGKPTSSTP
jgi:hypothetical protein